jgi:Fungal protein kinase
MCKGYEVDDLDLYIRLEIQDSVRRGVKGFHNFFPDVSAEEWDCVVECPEPHTNETTCLAGWSWVDKTPSGFDCWPIKPSGEDASEWFEKLNGYLRESGSDIRFHAPNNGGCDVLCTQKVIDDKGAEMVMKDYMYSWHDVLVVGKLRPNPREDLLASTILQLAKSVREVFGAQPGRRFVHGFTLCGDLARFYLFDRAGVSISDKFCINKNDHARMLFIKILLGYSEMDSGPLGFNTSYTDENGKPFLPSTRERWPKRLFIDGNEFHLVKLLFYQPTIVSRGTLCWLARDSEGRECVIKDAWRPKSLKHEGELLLKAQKSGVWGGVEYGLHGDFIWDGRRDEVDSCVRSYLNYEDSKWVKISAWREEGEDSISCASSLGERRYGRLTTQENANEENRKQSDDSDQDGNKNFPEDRVHSYVITYTVGIPITKFESKCQLIEAFRDAIKRIFLTPIVLYGSELTPSRSSFIIRRRENPTPGCVDQ